MGRPTVHGTPPSHQHRLYLRRIRLDRGGYDPNGTYFGLGQPLFWYASEDGSIDAVLRARDRNEAIDKILRIYPNARFYGAIRG